MSEVIDEIRAARPRRFRPYPEYRDSGIEWLGKIPTHWTIGRLKTLADVQLSNVDKKSEEGQVPVRLCNYVDVYYNERITDNIEFMEATASTEQVRRFSLRAGDVLITKDSESWNDIAVPATVAEDLPGVLCGYHLAHVRPGPDLDGSFLGRAFSAVGLRDQFHVAANGITRFGLGGDAIRTGVFPVMPIVEQRAIAAFLDRETNTIDGLIGRKERLIELLQEKRTALIARAVTRGLDPAVPVKDSGVEWLGEIPAHWETLRLSQAVKTLMDFRGRTPLKLGMNWGGEIPAVSAVNVRDGFVDLSRGVNYGSPSLHDRWMTQGPTEKDDILFTTEAPLGNVALIPDDERYILSQRVVLFRADTDEILPRFLGAFLGSSAFRRAVEARATGSTAEGIKRRHLMALRLANPPLNEQEAISESIDQRLATIDALITKVREAIDRLQEFRSALISSAVTGKIDVREEAA